MPNGFSGISRSVGEVRGGAGKVLGSNGYKQVTQGLDAFFGSVSVARRFRVAIDESTYDLGTWANASGLSVTWDTCEYRTGDKWNHPLIYPGIPRYQRIKLSRAACHDSQTVQQWLRDTARRNKPLTGAVALVDWLGQATVTWELREFFPAGWGISEFNAAGGHVAMETLELAHTGFLDDQFAPDAATGGSAGTAVKASTAKGQP
ncbi:phage tail protein [Streptomyces sp. NPDC001288]|uniref:phage tail protein n=1 Tax=unclassified Streptomyces TaxID=2593676 RepID=UPI00331F0964